MHVYSCCSVTKSCPTLQSHGLQNTRLPRPSLFPGMCSDSCPLSQWCNLTISSPIAPFSFHLRSFPASESFPMIWLFPSGGQSIGVLASILPMNIQDWFSLGLTGLISLQSKGLSVVFSSTTVQKHQFFSTKPSLWSNSHICTWLLENIALTRWTFVSKVISLLFKMLSSLVIAFPTKSKHLLISWLQSQSTVILEPKKIKFVTVSIVSHLFAMKLWDRISWSLFFVCWVLN